MLSEEEVKRIAKLAKISLSDENVKNFPTQLSNVLEYVDILTEVNTDGVAETFQVTGLQNVKDEDLVLTSQSSREELIECSDLPLDSKQVRVMRVVK